MTGDSEIDYVFEVEGTAMVEVEQTLLDQYKQMHRDGAFKGLSLRPHLNDITRLVMKHNPRSILDYGCGKAELYTALNLRERWQAMVYLYDPAVPEFATKPKGLFDGVICTDVLEHIPEEEVRAILDDVLLHARVAQHQRRANVMCRLGRST